MEDLDLIKAPTEVNGHEANDRNAISDDMRAKLAALNPSFAKYEPVETSPALPFPEDISNTTTQFLALDKCERNRHFLQLVEIDVLSEEKGTSQGRPYKLQYDPEWLAILRVFAPELQVDGDPNGRVPQHRGDTYYRKRIVEEEDYIKKHVVEADLIDVPNNFSITAPVYDPNLQVDSRDMPREVTSPQTSAFCSMIGIENRFDITEEERDARIARGARPEQPRFGGGRGGRGGGRGGFNNRGGGGRGANRGGRGVRGRGRW
jgi:lariat debranching enzyme